MFRITAGSLFLYFKERWLPTERLFENEFVFPHQRRLEQFWVNSLVTRSADPVSRLVTTKRISSPCVVTSQKRQ
jgi:hypothetical protein